MDFQNQLLALLKEEDAQIIVIMSFGLQVIEFLTLSALTLIKASVVGLVIDNEECSI
jgi:hypothetical protein